MQRKGESGEDRESIAHALTGTISSSTILTARVTTRANSISKPEGVTT